MKPNVRDQRRRAVGAPLARESLWEPLAVPASGVTTSDDRCIALLGNRAAKLDKLFEITLSNYSNRDSGFYEFLGFTMLSTFRVAGEFCRILIPNNKDGSPFRDARSNLKTSGSSQVGGVPS
jgi:hypothetical protein